MKRFVIGDVHGCFEPLQRLLEQLGADPERDRFHFLGDLVNRGPRSLKTLRFVHAMGERATVTLGNHDLHLLAVAHGIRAAGKKDTFDRILRAPDRDELLDWLRTRSVLELDESGSHVRVHAGIHPAWTLDEARLRAAELERALRRDDWLDFLGVMYGNEPRRPSAAGNRIERLRIAVNVFTRMRYCRADGALAFDASGPPASADELLAWYRVPARRPIELPILFGHWSAHPAMGPVGVVPMDRGCVWAGWLAGMRVDKPRPAMAVSSE